MKFVAVLGAQVGSTLSVILTLLLGCTIPISVQAQPSLVYVQPANGSVDVALDSSFVFVFDKPMVTSTARNGNDGDVQASISWSTNVEASKFETPPSWDSSGMVLTCRYVGNLPPSTTITWTINSPICEKKLIAQSDLSPVATTSGTFTTAKDCYSSGLPLGQGAIQLFKQISYRQSGPANPAQDPTDPPAFGAQVLPPSVNDLTNIKLRTTAGGFVDMQQADGHFIFWENFSSASAMDAKYPAGNYALILSRASSPDEEVPIELPGGTTYPPIPQINNYDAAQVIDSTKAFTLDFNAFTGIAPSDFVEFEVRDEFGTLVLSAPNSCAALALTNTATSFEIPAGTLSAGKSYHGALSFQKTFYFNTTTSQSYVMIGALYSRTHFPLATIGAPSNQSPQITTAKFQDGHFSFNVVDLPAAVAYRLQYTTSLVPTEWFDLQTLDSTTAMPLIDTQSGPTGGQRFYRLISP
ncbi:hypothetical protein GC207_08025 [bacterium]|nr:hypothetical protein [bacterium]